MNKVVKIVIGILIVMIIIWCITFSIDFYRASNMKEPIFTIAAHKDADTPETTTYEGLGYRVIVEQNILNEDNKQIIKTEMYIFNKFITGSIAEHNKNDSIVEKDETLKQTSFRAIVISSNEKSILVKPMEEEDIQKLSDKVSIELGEKNDMLYFEGAELLITYTGNIIETYPTQINVVKIQTETEYKTKIEELPKEYSLAEAIKDNCVISIHGDELYNKDELDRFLENVNSNKPDFIRCINYSVEGEMLITDITFEGNNSFRACVDWTRDNWSAEDDRTYKTGRFTKLEELKEDGKRTTINLKNPIEGELEQVFIISYTEESKEINNYEPEYLSENQQNEETTNKDIPSSYELKKMGNLQYYLYTPSNPTSSMPLIMYLHGGTNKKSNVEALLTTDGFPQYLYDGLYDDLRAYVVIPKLENNYTGWADISDDLRNLIKTMNTNYEIDMKKVSLTGHSMGGTGTYQVQIKLPNTFACIAPMSGSIKNTEANLNALAKTKIWSFVGTNDTIVSPDSSRTIIDELKRKGADAKITEFENATHFDVPALGYKNTELIEWLVNCGEI